jgi:hypothetical protein
MGYRRWKEKAETLAEMRSEVKILEKTAGAFSPRGNDFVSVSRYVAVSAQGFAGSPQEFWKS